MTLKEYLEKQGLNPVTSGKNVTSGWTNIQCIFAGCNDRSNHLGISPTGFYHCWLCGKKGHLTDIITEVENCTRSKAEQIVKKLNFEKPETDFNFAKSVTLPAGIKDTPLPAHIKYLKSRNFNPRQIIKKYKLKFCGPVGDYRMRLIIPFFLNNKFMTFAGRSILEDVEPKYKNLLKEKSVLDPKSTIYNIDNIKTQSIIICEGIFDTWRIGDNTVALSGKTISSNQIYLLTQKNIKNIFILLDSDAVENAEKISVQLSCFFNHVEIIEIDTGDPDELEINDINYLRRLLK